MFHCKKEFNQKHPLIPSCLARAPYNTDPHLKAHRASWHSALRKSVDKETTEVSPRADSHTQTFLYPFNKDLPRLATHQSLFSTLRWQWRVKTNTVSTLWGRYTHEKTTRWNTVLQLQRCHAGAGLGVTEESYLKAMAFQLFLKTGLVLTTQREGWEPLTALSWPWALEWA